MNQLVTGATAMGFAVAALFFLRFWRETQDRLFAYFSHSFFLLAVNRAAIGLADQGAGGGDHFYWVRFLSFALIQIGILDKNLGRKTTGQ